MNLVVAISGATGAIYGVRLLEVLHAMPQVTTYAVLSHWARQTIPLETGRAPEEVLALADRALLLNTWWVIIIPGLFLVVTLLCITNIGHFFRTRHNKGPSNL